MLELRILNGLHRGATLPLDEHSLVIGADDAADVVLLDPGVEAEHASLRWTGSEWALSSLDGEILGAETNQPLASLELMPGEFARVGHVWLSVVDSGTPWTEPPPEPIDIEPDELESEYYEDVFDSETGAEHGEDPSAAGKSLEFDRDKAESQPESGIDGPAVEGKRKWSKPQLIFGCIGILTVLSAWAAFQITGGSDKALPLKPGFVNADGTVKTAEANGGLSAAVRNDENMTPEELRIAFRKRLAEIDLLKRFDLNLRDNAWTMQAALDDEEAARFERALAAFVARHKIMFPISAKVGNAEHMLPFKIRQVISGANASVVTLDGNRLYVGDEYQGVRLVSIQGSRLTFAGKRKIEVRW